MNGFVQEIIADLKSYLEYLREMGIESIPTSEERPRETFLNSSLIPPMPPTLEEVRKELGDCRRCKLHRTRHTLVFGEGNKKAILMIIGEGPGYEEDVQGKPFVGRAGQLLTKILQSIHLQREEVYITNIIKCRPPQNRNPEPEEIQNCYPFLLKQIHAIQPQIICALGTFAAQTLLKTDAKITTLRGRFYEFTPLESPAIHPVGCVLSNGVNGGDDINKTSRRVESTTIPLAESSLRHRKGEGKTPSFLSGFAGIKVLPTYHPAYLLRNPERKREVWEDMKQISKWMADHVGIDSYREEASHPVGENRR
jgi:uracil-DNA glycosylase family 4